MKLKHLWGLLAICLLLPASAFPEGDVILSDETGTVLETSIDSRELSPGDEGDDVRVLQQRLADLYYYTGAISGSYGDGTRLAIKAFQEDFSLPVTGKADMQTQSELFAADYRPLRYGSSGEDVKALQTRLAALGYYTGRISGNYLTSTQEAVAAFQEKIGEDATGEADVDTQAVLFSGDALSRTARTPEPHSTPTPTLNAGFLVDENVSAVTPAPTVAYTKRLSRGSTGKLVKQLQTRLTDLGYYAGPISGNFLAKTATAVKSFQKQNGLESDGIVGEMTWELLFNDPDIVLPADTPRPTPEPTPVPFAITVDVTNQVTTVYGRDENGAYTVPIRQMLCSTGTKANPSDVGDWVLSGRTARWCYFPQWGGHAQFWTKINGSIAFHSVIYNTVNTMDLSLKSYKALGKRASHGCIRLLVADAKWIYDNAGKGTVVTIREDLPADPELRAALKVPPLNKKTMLPQSTPAPTPEPDYRSGAQPPLPLKKLQKNNASEAVYWMQRKLTDLGYYRGWCSGTFLDGTLKAVKAFQKDAGLKVTGVADVATLEALYAEELATPTPAPTIPLP